MKTIKVIPAAFWLGECSCGASIENPETGGYIFYRDDYHKLEDLSVRCNECDKVYRLPEMLLYSTKG